MNPLVVAVLISLVVGCAYVAWEVGRKNVPPDRMESMSDRAKRVLGSYIESGFRGSARGFAPPLCSCHGIPQKWHRDSRRKSGGYYQCAARGRKRVAA